MSTDYALAYGTHATPAEGRCAMECGAGDRIASLRPVVDSSTLRAALGELERVRRETRRVWSEKLGAAWFAAWAASSRSAARDAARAALAPTVEEPRESAFALLDRMLPTVPLAPPVVQEPRLRVFAATG